MAPVSSDRTLAQRYHPGTVYRSSHRRTADRVSITHLLGSIRRRAGPWEGGTGSGEMGKAAQEQKLIAKTDNNAEDDIREFLSSLGYEKVDFPPGSLSASRGA